MKSFLLRVYVIKYGDVKLIDARVRVFTIVMEYKIKSNNTYEPVGGRRKTKTNLTTRDSNYSVSYIIPVRYKSQHTYE